MEQKTPLYDAHVALGGKMVPFAGYLLPVQYSGVIAEHLAVRRKAGLFDVSHMGELRLSGPDSLANLNRLMTNDFTGLAVGRVRYSPMCNERGGVIDDLLVYRAEAEKWLIVVNASNRQKDADWISAHLTGEVEFEDASDSFAQIALQGPNAQAILERLCDPAQIPRKYYSFTDAVGVRIPGGTPGDGPTAIIAVPGGGETPRVKPGEVICCVSRTGYTGEDGFELYCGAEDARFLWDALLETGADLGLIPCGLGARDTLRLEASMPLYGHEMDDTITPFETGLDFAVKMGKDFIGRDAIAAKGAPAIKRVGLKVTGRGIVREACPLYLGEKQVGHSTSGTHCPQLGGAYAMALADAGIETGTELEAEVRGRRIACEVVPLPFYKR